MAERQGFSSSVSVLARIQFLNWRRVAVTL
jgi:hypothetical protein